MEIYYCFSCGKEPLYLTEVSDPDSDYFDEPCCPYCGSIQVTTKNEDDEDDDD